MEEIFHGWLAECTHLFDFLDGRRCQMRRVRRQTAHATLFDTCFFRDDYRTFLRLVPENDEKLESPQSNRDEDLWIESYSNHELDSYYKFEVFHIAQKSHVIQ